MQIKTLLTRPAITIEPATPLRDARALMRRRGIRHLPVVDHHRLVGMLAKRDIERADVSSIPEIARHDWAAAVAGLVVADVMARDPLALHPETPVAEAAPLARDRRDGAGRCEVAGGPVARESAQRAEERAAALIVIGTAARRGVLGGLVATLGDRLARLAPCPVLAVPRIGARDARR